MTKPAGSAQNGLWRVAAFCGAIALFCLALLLLPVVGAAFYLLYVFVSEAAAALF